MLQPIIRHGRTPCHTQQYLVVTYKGWVVPSHSKGYYVDYDMVFYMQADDDVLNKDTSIPSNHACNRACVTVWSSSAACNQPRIDVIKYGSKSCHGTGSKKPCCHIWPKKYEMEVILLAICQPCLLSDKWQNLTPWICFCQNWPGSNLQLCLKGCCLMKWS